MSTKQTLRFGAAVLQALPDISPELMQKWIENPAHLQEALFALKGFGDQFTTGIENFGIGIAGSCRDVYLFYKTDSRVRISEAFRQKFVENHLIRDATLLPEISLKLTKAKVVTSDINFRIELPKDHVFFDTTILLGVILDLIITSKTGCGLSKEFPNIFFATQKRGGDTTTVSVKYDGSRGVWVIDYYYPGTMKWRKGTVIFIPAN